MSLPTHTTFHFPYSQFNLHELHNREEREKNPVPELTIEEKNVKKLAAVEATREHGKQLFLEKKFDHAKAVYERGLLIINGAYKLTHEQQQRIDELELLLNLNLASVELRRDDPRQAITYCRLAIQLDPNVVKAYNRMAQAYIKLLEWDEALAQTTKALEISPDDTVATKLQQRIKILKQKEVQQQKAYQRNIAKRLASS
jgi:tetratricopeptide (TPR) repeat protein